MLFLAGGDHEDYINGQKQTRRHPPKCRRVIYRMVFFLFKSEKTTALKFIQNRRSCYKWSV